MSYIRTKNVNGNLYYYLVEGKREGNKVRQKIIKYLGKNPQNLPQNQSNKQAQHQQDKVKVNTTLLHLVFAKELENNGFKKSIKSPHIWYRYEKNNKLIIISNKTKTVLEYNTKTKKGGKTSIKFNKGILSTHSLRQLFGKSKTKRKRQVSFKLLIKIMDKSTKYLQEKLIGGRL